MKKHRLTTDQNVQDAVRDAVKRQAEIVVRETRGRGLGALVLRVSPTGSARWYFAHTVERRMRMLPIGPYGTRAGEFTLQAARAECGRLHGQRAAAPGGDLLLARRSERAQEKQAARALAAKVEAAEHGTLRALLDAYVAHLDREGKSATAADVRRLVRLHVVEAFPTYAAAPAAALTSRNAAEIIRKIIEAGKGRTAAKVRAYMRAAYALAQRAETDPTAPSTMLPFAIESNPVASVGALSKFNRVSEHALTEPELRALMKRLDATETPSAIVLRLSLLLGGQRFNQLLRARVVDFDEPAGTITLYDPKGRRATPRAHVLPLPERALVQLKARAKIARALPSEWIFPAANGLPATTTTVSKYLATVRAAMVTDKESRDFELADLRRTCETLLASIGISKDTRAQIQSHGLGGVQARHYDRYDYMAEKTAALDAWARWLATAPPNNVRAIRGARPRSRRAAA